MTSGSGTEAKNDITTMGGGAMLPPLSTTIDIPALVMPTNCATVNDAGEIDTPSPKTNPKFVDDEFFAPTNFVFVIGDRTDVHPMPAVMKVSIRKSAPPIADCLSDTNLEGAHRPLSKSTSDVVGGPQRNTMPKGRWQMPLHAATKPLYMIQCLNHSGADPLDPPLNRRGNV
jgi:hypothetical protein